VGGIFLLHFMPLNFNASGRESPSCTLALLNFNVGGKGSPSCTLAPHHFDTNGSGQLNKTRRATMTLKTHGSYSHRVLYPYNPLKPLPLPATNLYLWVQVRVSMDKSTDSPGDTPGSVWKSGYRTGKKL